MKATWNFNSRYGYGIIRWEDGREVFMQGDEASQLDDEVEACETGEQVDLLLDQYEHIAEMPESEDDDDDN